MKKLIDYLEYTGIKQLVFARKLGTNTTTLHNILRKGLMPSLEIAVAIERETKGKVSVYDWLKTKENQKSKIDKQHGE